MGSAFTYPPRHAVESPHGRPGNSHREGPRGMPARPAGNPQGRSNNFESWPATIPAQEPALVKTGAAIQVRLPVGWILAKDCEDDKIREDGCPP